MNYPLNLQRLITEYKQLRTLQGFTPQQRGQRFNQFIADVLGYWGITAKANIGTGYGEIDVAFKFEGTQFIVEAKWEKERIDFGPMSKLKARLEQRPEGTTGILLSMSGFTSEVIKQLGGTQLAILFLDLKHFEAMLSGFIPPEEMLSVLKEKAQIYGERYVPLDDVLSVFELPKSDVDIDFSKWDKPIVVESELGFEAEVVAANLPTSPTKIVEYKKGQILFTQPDGVYLLDIARKKVEPFLAVPNCKDIVVMPDQWVYIARSIGVARYKPKEGIHIVGGLSDNSSRSRVFLLGNGNDVWVVADEDPYVPPTYIRDDWMYTPPTPPAPTITKLGEKLGDEQRYPTDLFGGHVNNIALVEGNQLLALSEARGELCLLPPFEGPAQSLWYGLRNDYPQLKAALGLPDGQVLAAVAGVHELRHFAPKGNFLRSPNRYGIKLVVGDIAADVPTSITQLNVFGEYIALAQSADGGGYILANHGPNDQETKGILIRWQWKQPLQPLQHSP